MKDILRWNKVINQVKLKLLIAYELGDRLRFKFLCHLGNRLFIYQGRHEAIMNEKELWEKIEEGESMHFIPQEGV